MNNIDTFFVYHLLNGNALRTALTFEVAPETIARLAATESWDEKIKNYNHKPGGESNELENGNHQCFCRYQVMRLQALLGEIFDALEARPPETLFMVQTKSAKSFSTRAIAELAEVAVTAQNLDLRASGEPVPLGAACGRVSGSEISACFVRAMNIADGFGLDSVALVRNVIKPKSKPNPV